MDLDRNTSEPWFEKGDIRIKDKSQMFVRLFPFLLELLWVETDLV